MEPKYRLEVYSLGYLGWHIFSAEDLRLYDKSQKSKAALI